MKSGRKNKPTALKLIQGNPGHRPINETEPKPAKVFAPKAPAHLSRFEKAKWRKLTQQLSACRVLTELDLDALEMYVTHWCTMNTALRDISERGKLLASPRGGFVWNPSWAEYKHAAKVVQSLMSEFGMTPASRTGIVASADDEGANRWSKF